MVTMATGLSGLEGGRREEMGGWEEGEREGIMGSGVGVCIF